MISGIVTGSCIVLAWSVILLILLVKHIRRYSLRRAGKPNPQYEKKLEKKRERQVEQSKKFIVTPDPAVFLNCMPDEPTSPPVGGAPSQSRTDDIEFEDLQRPESTSMLLESGSPAGMSSPDLGRGPSTLSSHVH